mmetsp:Transcript_2972/g.9779  ORF Transcript_2972/g.9779 Transcript_2972/m.9779 type:complete len:295 (-) Transcript_2972:480-1364(-)
MSSWSTHSPNPRSSTAAPKTGAPIRRSTCRSLSARSLASPAERVTEVIEPVMMFLSGSRTTWARLSPCTDATTAAPRPTMVRAAWHSSRVESSSTTTTSGDWFSIASIMTAACPPRRSCPTVSTRALPIARSTGTESVPQISSVLSTMQTMVPSSDASSLASSRSTVVLPTLGGPMMSKPPRETRRTSCRTSQPPSPPSIGATCPCSVRPIRATSPIMPRPSGLVTACTMREMRCSVPGMPVRRASLPIPRKSGTKAERWSTSTSSFERMAKFLRRFAPAGGWKTSSSRRPTTR